MDGEHPCARIFAAYGGAEEQAWDAHVVHILRLAQSLGGGVHPEHALAQNARILLRRQFPVLAKNIRRQEHRILNFFIAGTPQILFFSAFATCSRVGAGFISSRALGRHDHAGVQNPHCTAPDLEKA
jgi:hypothetical protein